MCKVFIEHAQFKPLSYIRQKVNNRLSQRIENDPNGGIAKMMPDGGLDSLTKEVHFNPGRPYPDG